MKRILITLVFVLSLVSYAQAQKTIYYESDYALDYIRKKRIDGKAVISFTKEVIKLNWVGTELSFNIVETKYIKEEKIIVYSVVQKGKDGKDIHGLIEVRDRISENDPFLIGFKTGDTIHYYFNVIKSHIKNS